MFHKNEVEFLVFLYDKKVTGTKIFNRIIQLIILEDIK